MNKTKPMKENYVKVMFVSCLFGILLGGVLIWCSGIYESDTNSYAKKSMMEIFHDVTEWFEAGYSLMKTTKLDEHTTEDITEDTVTMEETVAEEEEKSAYIGCTTTIGSYPKTAEGDLQPIEWIAIASEEDKILLVSKYTIDNVSFEDGFYDSSWETSQLRKWHEDFYQHSFSDGEKQWIVPTETEVGVYDTVFSLSKREMEEYLPQYSYRRTQATDYAAVKDVLHSETSSNYWSRTIYEEKSDAAYSVNFNADFSITGVYALVMGVRPAMYINKNADVKWTIDNKMDNEIKYRKLTVIGKYEQDNDPSNGPEDMNWIILDESDDALLLIAESPIDAMKYYCSEENTTWETSDVRKWLNSEEGFYGIAFSDEEKARILSAEISTKKSIYGADGGRDTVDKVWILSEEETRHYLMDGAFLAQPTKYARSKCTSSVIRIWCRDPGLNQTTFQTAYNDGSIYHEGWSVFQDAYVRPVIRVKTTRYESDEK